MWLVLVIYFNICYNYVVCFVWIVRLKLIRIWIVLLFYVEESFDGDWLDDLYREYKGFEEVCRIFVWFEEIFNFKLFLKVLNFNIIFFFC